MFGWILFQYVILKNWTVDTHPRAFLIKTEHQRSTEGRMLRPNAEDFENSASASATEGFKVIGQRLGRRLSI